MRQRRHFHALHTRLKALDTLTNRPLDITLEVEHTNGGVVEVEQPQLGSALAVPGVAIEQLDQVTFDRLDDLGKPRLSGRSLRGVRCCQSLKQPRAEHATRLQHDRSLPYSLSSRPTSDSSKLAPMYLKCGRTASDT